MKKTLLISAAMLAAIIAADAREVSAARAREIASTVIPTIGSQGSMHKARPMVPADESVPYYLFNAGDNTGYVIVAGDDRLPAVLGYSREGSLDAGNMPEQLQFLLDMSVLSVKGQEDIPAATSVTAGTPVVEPLLDDINWGQSDPFNTLCPVLSNGQRGYVGCVATAMAQIMRFYGYPAQGTGTHSYTDGGLTLSADFGSTTYDWSNMPRVVPEKPTDAQVKAYSTLCYHLGVATDMTYATGGSGAYTMVVPGALRDHFGYTASLRMHLRDYYNTDEWMSMIRSELDAGRPVYYSASSEDGAGGHAFVCDGYDSEGYVHMNWGWYGSSNGYFYINHLNPGELGTGGGSGAYNVSQEILTHFMPAVDGDAPSSAIYGDTRLSCDAIASGITMMCFIGNLDTDSFNGDVMAVLIDDEDNIKATLKTQSITVGPFKAGRSGSLQLTMHDIPNRVSDVANGNYRLKFAYRTPSMDEPELLRHPIGLPSYCNCTVLNGDIFVTDKHEPAPDVVMTTPLEPDGEIYTDGSARFNVGVRNNSRDFRLSTVVLTLTAVDNPEISFSSEYRVNVYDLSESDLTMDIDIPGEAVPGRYKVELAHKGHLDKPFATCDSKETIVEILPAISNPVIRFVSDPIWQSASTVTGAFDRGDIIYIAARAKNYAAAGETMVVCRLVDEAGNASVLRADSYVWTKGEQRNVIISTYLTADPGKYSLAFSYLDAAGNEMPIKTSDNIDEIEIKESDYTPFEVTAFDMPSNIKAGEKVDCSITIRGLQTVKGTFYVRVRQFTNTNGEIVTVKYNLNIVAGEDQTIKFAYRPGVADGRYMTMVEFREMGQNLTIPAGGHHVYYKEITIGDTSGVDSVITDGGDASELWYNLQGIRVENPAAPGIYIRRQGNKTEKILIK